MVGHIFTHPLIFLSLWKTRKKLPIRQAGTSRKRNIFRFPSDYPLWFLLCVSLTLWYTPPPRPPAPHRQQLEPFGIQITQRAQICWNNKHVPTNHPPGPSCAKTVPHCLQFFQRLSIAWASETLYCRPIWFQFCLHSVLSRFLHRSETTRVSGTRLNGVQWMFLRLYKLQFSVDPSRWQESIDMGPVLCNWDGWPVLSAVFSVYVYVNVLPPLSAGLARCDPGCIQPLEAMLAKATNDD